MKKKKNFLTRVYKALTHPRLLADYILTNFLTPIFPDRTYLKLKSKIIFGKSFNLVNPTSFNEKMNWLKLNNQNTNYYNLVDKIRVKEHVSKLIGEEYIVPLIATWDRINELEFSDLPDICVLKTNQDSGGAIIYQKGKSNLKEIKKKLKSRMHLFNYYFYSREFPYKGVKKKIFAEKFLENEENEDVLIDYKFWCFNGEPKVLYITKKSFEYFENFYDMDFNPIYIKHGAKRREPEFDKPEVFEKMKELSRILSSEIPFVRIDFYYVKNHIYFGEYTFFDWGGFKPFEDDWDNKLGEYLSLS